MPMEDIRVSRHSRCSLKRLGNTPTAAARLEWAEMHCELGPARSRSAMLGDGALALLEACPCAEKKYRFLMADAMFHADMAVAPFLRC